MHILFTFPIKDAQEELLRKEFADIDFHFAKSIDETKEIGRYTVIVTYGEDLNEEVVKQAVSLKWVMVASAGVEKMPLRALDEKGILVTNVRGIHKIPMAETVMAHILAMKRGLPQLYEAQKKKEWNSRVRTSELHGSTAVILGPGAIGSEIGRLLRAFGVKTIGCNRSGRAAEDMEETITFDKLIDRLPEADYLISILPSTPETKGLLTEEHFKAMKNTAVFMNFGRGDAVKEKVLTDALRNGQIGHAVLDVFETEPLPAESELWTMPNVTVSPHVSSHSGNYITRALDIFVPNLKKWKAGGKDMINTVSLEKGY